MWTNEESLQVNPQSFFSFSSLKAQTGDESKMAAEKKPEKFVLRKNRSLSGHLLCNKGCNKDNIKIQIVTTYTQTGKGNFKKYN